MKRMLVIIWLLAATGAFAQKAGPSTLNASGGSKQIGANTFEWSVAEMTVVNTYSSPTLVLTQGILQPMVWPTGINTNTAAQHGDIQIYPNPVENELTLQCDFSGGGKLHYVLLDITGKTIKANEEQLASGKEKIRIDFSGLATGDYLLQVIYRQQDISATSSFKIAKTH